jgi:hypothetical protein
MGKGAVCHSHRRSAGPRRLSRVGACLLFAASSIPGARAAVVVADMFGYHLDQAPACGGQETPANHAAWVLVQQYRAHPLQVQSWKQAADQLRPTLETAAAGGDSWALYTLGHFVYNVDKGQVPATDPRRKELENKAHSTLQKAVEAGNCYAALTLWQEKVSPLTNLSSPTLGFINTRNYTAAQQTLDAAKVTLGEGWSLRQKALDLGLEQGGGAVLVTGSETTTKDYASKVASLQKRLDDADGATERLAAEREASDPKRLAGIAAANAAKQAQEEQYQRDLAAFESSMKQEKKVGDDVCVLEAANVLECGYVDRIANGKVQIAIHHSGAAGTTTVDTNMYGGTTVTSTGGVAASEEHVWVDADQVGMHSSVTMTLITHPYQGLLDFFGLSGGAPSSQITK